MPACTRSLGKPAAGPGVQPPTQAGARAAARAAKRAREKLAEDIERLCTDAGITLTALARAAGVPHGHVSRIIAGKAAPTIETYAKLAVPLGADLATRLYPNTGPVMRDRHQARIVESLLGELHPRWRAFSEVPVWKPARGWIDVVLADQRARLLIATEVQSELRRLEQVIRWSREKAESLPSWSGWPALGPPASLDRASESSPQISQLLIVRRTRATRDVAREFARQLAVAYPSHPEDAIAALTGPARWPGSALVLMVIDHRGVRFQSGR